MIHAWIILGTLVPFFIIFATLPHIEHAPEEKDSVGRVYGGFHGRGR